MYKRQVCRQAAGRAGQVVCLCGTGNNGGDGLAAMRILMEENPAFRGECWLLPGRLSADAQRELDRLTEDVYKRQCSYCVSRLTKSRRRRERPWRRKRCV